MLAWSLTKIASGQKECLMDKVDSSILMVVATKEPMSKEFLVVKEELSVHRGGIMKENFINNKLKEEESLLFKILVIDIKDNGKEIFLMEEDNKPG